MACAYKTYTHSPLKHKHVEQASARAFKELMGDNSISLLYNFNKRSLADHKR